MISTTILPLEKSIVNDDRLWTGIDGASPQNPMSNCNITCFCWLPFPDGHFVFPSMGIPETVKRKDVSPEIDNNQGWKLALEVRIDPIETELFTLWIYVLRGPASLSLVICNSASRPNLEEKTRPGNKQWI